MPQVPPLHGQAADFAGGRLHPQRGRLVRGSLLVEQEAELVWFLELVELVELLELELEHRVEWQLRLERELLGDLEQQR